MQKEKLLALLVVHHILHVSRIRVKGLTISLLSHSHVEVYGPPADGSELH